MTVAAIALGAVAAALVVASPPRLPHHGAADVVPGTRPHRGPAVILAGSGGAAVLVATVEGTRLALAVIVAASVAATALLVRRSRAARTAQRRRDLVVDVVEALAGELQAGQPLLHCLEHCVEVWPDFDAVVSAAGLGADVPSALRRLAELPGAEGLREVASAWQVAQRSGAGLAAALSHVAASARARQSTRHLVQGELASAQATARLVALLPAASLAMAAGIGGQPWHFLLGTAPGLVCLALGVALAFAGLLWIDRIATGVLGG